MKNIKSNNINQDQPNSHQYDDLILIISAIGLLIGTINAFLPMQEINEKLFNIDKYKAATLTQTYGQVEHEFDTDYDIENPATAERAREARVKKFEKPKSVSNK